jgi:hypothetical protein
MPKQSRGPMRLPRTYQVLAMTKKVERSQRQYTRASALMGGGTVRVQFRTQPVTLHCPYSLYPVATAVTTGVLPLMSSLSPTV